MSKARIAGFVFLLAMVTGLFAEFYVRFPGSLVVPGDAAKTAENLLTDERLYRIGIANNIFTFVLDVILIWALYFLLRTVNPQLALLALLFRLIETTLACVAIISSYVAMELIADADHSKAFDVVQLHSLAVLHYSYGLTFNIVAIFLGIGSLLFNYLFFSSKYIPRALSSWGIFASAVLLVSQFVIIIYPEVEKTMIPACYGPIVIDEIALGLWLLIKGVKAAPQADAASELSAL